MITLDEIEGADKVSLNIFGPRNTNFLIKSALTLNGRPAAKIQVEDVVNSEKPYKDENLMVYPIIINSNQQEIKPKTQKNLLFKNLQKDNNEKANEDVELLQDKAYDSSICCYAFHTPKIRGKFDMNKAISLGVPKGPKFGLLTNGQSVTNSEGETILPEQVMKPDILGSVILVVKCPSSEYLPSLFNSMNEYQNNGTHSASIEVIYHFTPKHIFDQTEYQNWRKQFPSRVIVCFLKSFFQLYIFIY